MTKSKYFVAAAFSLFLFAGTAHAQATTASYTINDAEPLKVQYLGADGEFLRFQVTFNYNEAEKARFTIDARNEGELYSSGVTNSLKVSTVKIKKLEPFQVLSFKLFVGKKLYSKTFAVDTKLVETTTVAESDISSR